MLFSFENDLYATCLYSEVKEDAEMEFQPPV